MKTKRLHIRRFQPDDLADLFKLLSDKEVMRYLEKPYTLKEQNSFYKKQVYTNIRLSSQ